MVYIISVADPDPHQSDTGNLDPDPDQSDKLDPDPDPNPNQLAADKSKCMECEPIWALFPRLLGTLDPDPHPHQSEK
jgi:hypothetical protein